MSTKVIFLPGCDGATFYGCDDHRNLIPGMEYEVIQARDLGFQTNYTLKGVVGEYNSVWFAKATEETKVHIGCAKQLPDGMESCKCVRIADRSLVATSLVTGIRHLNSGVFEVDTLNSTYYLYVDLEEGCVPERVATANEKRSVYVGTSSQQPVVGKSLVCTRMEKYELNKVITSTVVNVEYLSNHVFKVTTLNSIYLIAMLY